MPAFVSNLNGYNFVSTGATPTNLASPFPRDVFSVDREDLLPSLSLDMLTAQHATTWSPSYIPDSEETDFHRSETNFEAYLNTSFEIFAPSAHPFYQRTT